MDTPIVPTITLENAKKILQEVVSYENPMPTVEYSPIPPGRIKFLKGKVVFGKRRIGIDRQPKKIIITDWLRKKRGFENYKEFLAYRNFLKLLLDQCGECYIWTGKGKDGKLTKITNIKDLMEKLAIIEEIEPEMLAQKITEAGFSKDAHEVIDYARARELEEAFSPLTGVKSCQEISLEIFENEADCMRSLQDLESNLSAAQNTIIKITNNTQEDLLVKVMERFPNITYEFSPKYNDPIKDPIILQNIQTKHPSIFEKLRKIYIKPDYTHPLNQDQSRFITYNVDEDKKNKLKSDLFFLSNLNSIYTEIKDLNYFLEILPNCSKLESLTFYLDENLSEHNIQKLIEELKKIKTLKKLVLLGGSTLSRESFLKVNEIINNLPMIEEISYEPYPNMQEINFLKNQIKLMLHIPADVDEDGLTDTKENTTFITALSKQLNLKEVIIEFEKSMKGKLKIDSKTHQKIEQVTSLSLQKYAMADGYDLLKIFPNIESLNIQIDIPSTIRENLHFKNLTYLIVSKTSGERGVENQKEDFLLTAIELINSAPNLQSLQLDFFITTENIDFLLEKIQPKENIKKLSIRGDLTVKQLNEVFQKFPNLEELTISSIIPKMGSFLNEPFEKSDKLKMIKLSGSLLMYMPNSDKDKFRLKIKENFPNLKEKYDDYVETDFFRTRRKDLERKLPAKKPPLIEPEESSLIDTKKPNEVQNKSKVKYHLDPKTGSKENNINAKQIFLPKPNGEPAVKYYRIHLCKEIKLGKIIESVSQEPPPHIRFQEIKKTQSNLFQVYHENEEYKDNPDIFLGNFEIPPNHTGWHPIPSLTRKDEILHFSFKEDLEYTEFQGQAFIRRKSDADKKNPLRVSILIQRKPELYNPIPSTEKTHDISSEDLKILQFDDNGKIELSHVPIKILMEKIEKLTENEKIDLLFNFCHEFSVDDLTTYTDNNNDIHLLNAIIRESKGACRHRTEIFMALGQAFGISAKIMKVGNGVHSFIETEIDGSWKTLDLGGAPANLNTMPFENNEEDLENTTEETILNNNLPSNIPEDLEPEETDIELADVGVPETELKADNPFMTWNSLTSKAKNLNDYCNELKELCQKAIESTEDPKNILIMLNADQIEAFQLAMTEMIKNTGQKSYYMHTLDGISEEDIRIESDGTQTLIDSELFSFLKENNKTQSDNPHVLITNFSSYNASQVGHNSIMDKERKLKSTPIPPSIVNIVLLSKEKANSVGEDFYSRCHLISECPDFETPDSVNVILSQDASKISDDELKTFETASFFDDDWQSVLLGKISVQNRKYSAAAGSLISAIQAKKSGLILENAPWDSAEFRVFMNNLYVKRSFVFNGETYSLPDDFKLIAKTIDYTFSEKDIPTGNIETLEDKNLKPFILNSETFDLFLQNIHCEKDGSLSELPGWIAANKGTKDNPNEILVYVTETLSKTNWAQLLKISQENFCTLKVALAPHITLPIANIEFKAIQPMAAKHAIIIETNDIELAEEEIFEEASQKTTEPIVISINAHTTFNDLFEFKKPKEPSDGANSTNDALFEFIECDCLKKLLAGETVILKGNLSPSFAKEIESLFLTPPYLVLNGEIIYPENIGKLIIITESKNVLSSANSETRTYDVSESTHLEKLEQKYFGSGKNQDKLERFEKFKQSLSALKLRNPEIKFNYGQLNEMLAKMLKSEHPSSNPFKPFFRLDPTNPALATAKEIWEKDSNKKTPVDDIIKKRHAKISKELNHSPYLFIAGPSGVGKSTYILEGLKNPDGSEQKHDVYVGIDKLSEWLKPGIKDERKVLFIDEANLEREGTWDILEGLFNKTPGIVLNGKFHPLLPEHKVIFAGNFNHFAGRYKHRYFERHGQIFNFKELPDEFLSSRIIYPALDKLMPDLNKLNTKQRHQINNIFIEIYRELNQKPPHHPMTPRNLKTLCLRLSVALKEKDPLSEADLERMIYTVALDEMGHFLSPKQKSEWENKATPISSLPLQSFQGSEHFVVTPSREPALRLLHEQMKLRETVLSQKLDSFIVPGLLLEGPAGVGKSQMVIEYLKAEHPDKIFYHITPTDPAKMEELLIQAFHAGAIVIIDELNSLPLERLLNQLLSGVDPDGREAKQNGFFVVGTQNPITFSKRQQLSSALENRFRKIETGDYLESELRYIAQKMCPNNKKATRLVNQYLIAKAYAKKHQKTPVPSPRHLFRALATHAKTLKEDRSPRAPLLFQLHRDSDKMLEHTSTVQTKKPKIS